jgi:hypothetical protein
VAECVAGTPNTLGSCVCQRAALLKTGPATANVTKVPAAAFGGGGFYWAEYHYNFVADLAYSSIVAKREDVGVRVILENVRGRVARLRVTDDIVYFQPDSGDAVAISIDGESRPAPTMEEAFPASTGRVTADDMGVYLDGARLADPVDSFSETSDGVYLVESGFLRFQPFDGSSPQLLPLRVPPELAVDGVWASGTTLYISGLHQLVNEQAYELNLADLSVVGN